MKFYRYELAFNGEPQGIGLFQGIDDMGLTDDEVSGIMRKFDDLYCPVICTSDTLVFFFTELGNTRFNNVIQFLNSIIKLHGWQLIRIVIEADSFKTAIYHDDLQAVWTQKSLGVLNWEFC